MKKSLTVLSLVSLFSLSALAQDKKPAYTATPYIRFGLGYAFSHAGDASGNITNSAASQSYDFHKFSFGAGLNTAVAVGVWFTDHVGMELGANIGIAPQKSENSITTVGSGTTLSTQAKYTDYARTPVYLMPSIIIKTGGKQADLYARMGIAVNVAGHVREELQYSDGTNVQNQKEDYTFRTGVGFQGALGVMIPAAAKVSLFAEINGISMSQYAKSSELKEFSVNGIDRLYALDTKDIKTKYKRSFTLPTTTNNNQPATATTFSLPFSNIGFSIGVAFKL